MKMMIAFLCTSAMVSVALAAAPAVPDTPAAVDDVVYARTFTLDNGFHFCWSKDRPLVTTGTLLVLRVNPDLVVPRQTAEPVLYVGNQSAERVNSGHESGYVIAIVPGEVDLATAPIWFGTPELPERVDAAMIKSERAQADAAGIKPMAASKIKAALRSGGTQLNVADKDALLRGEVATLIETHSPEDRQLAEDFRVEVSKAAPKAQQD
jgi:hypothetical protein